MPVRIYDISRKLGLENKEILAAAKQLGIAAAKVPSSTLDKITAADFEEKLRVIFAEQIAAAAALAAAAAPPPPPPPEAPPPAAPPVPELGVAVTPPAPGEAVPPPQAEATPTPAPPAEIVPAPAESPVEIKPLPLPEPEVEAAPPLPPPPPPPPPGPQVGDKIGFIQLAPRPGPRTSEKVGPAKVSPARSGARPEPVRGRLGGRSQTRAQSPQLRAVAPSMRDMLAKPEAKPAAATTAKFVAPTTGEIISLKPPIAVRALAERLNQKPFKIIADLMEVGVFANVNQTMDEATAQRICAKYGYRFEVEKRERHTPAFPITPKKLDLDVEDKLEDLVPRAPVVTIMGHVDHGKTTLLDAIRKSDVAAGEAGGITQHIGAYTISFPHPERKKELAQITFLDTPGHAAFSAMRARGANVTDIVVLVVAANDGVMPQTLEALSHARAAKVPIIVAVNKVDHPNANTMRVRQQLQDRGLVPDDWGGDTIFAEVSALTKQGVDKLIEMILLQADLLELKANANRHAKGNVIESGLAPGGPTATALVRKGTLRVGDVVICGPYYGRVRALINEEGKRLKEAGPSVAVKLLGLNGVPEAGIEFSAVEDEKAARELAEQRQMDAKALAVEAKSKVTLENLFATLDAQQSKGLKIVVKADTQGSVEAIVDALKKIESDKIALEVIHSAVGTITESDALLAAASNAVVLGFHTRIDTGVADIAKREGVQIKLYTIIYELIDQVKEALTGLLEPVIKEVVTGAAEVKQVFALSKGAPVAGCVVSSGRIVRGKIRVRRRKELVYEGVTQTLRRFQDEVNEVRAGMECGIRVEGFGEFQVGDVLECYAVEKIAQKL
jgi:translation initiation factor IF-2